MTLLDTLDVAMRLRTTRGRVTELLKANPARYGAWKEKQGGGTFKYRERWRVPVASLELLRADLTRRGG